MTRRPIFWVVFSALGLAGAIVAVQLFTVALPNVSLDISMDRAAAMARDIARRVEEELTYPGQIKVTVIRETRASDVAR